jgi:radical SAM superfamily enzyme YgiQ (UPF0313 family)
MELPRRSRGDELLKPGELSSLRERLRGIASQHDLVSVIACAFDHRTRMLPFIYADTRMAPAGVRSIGAAMVDAGFSKTRIVLQQWNRKFSPSRMQLDGRVPDLFMVSTMGLHLGEARSLIRDAHLIDAGSRPLIIAGGPQARYQPGDLFSADPGDAASADVVVTGEEYVVLSLLEVLLAFRASRESMRSAFFRARDAGALDEIPGLVFGRGGGSGHGGMAEELIDTGIQRLLGNLDELPSSVLGYGLLEAPSRKSTLGNHAIPATRIRWLSPISSIVLTYGCKFSCPYCPIPAYNQRQYRSKSGERMAEEMAQLFLRYGLRHFFGCDDNFFNDEQHTMGIVDAINRAPCGNKALRNKARWYTEVTVHDTVKMKAHLPEIRRSGCRALWLGVEDMTASLVKKGQSVNTTLEAFTALRDAGICPMPMMMHHDSQPLYSRGSNYGLLNQVRLLRKAGAPTLQVLMITPSAGSRLYESTFESGQVMRTVGGRPVEAYMYDGNHVIASKIARPWRKQLNLLLVYLYFYNPLWFARAIWRYPRQRLGHRPALLQVFGMLGLIHTILRTAGWALRLAFQKIERFAAPPSSPLPMRDVAGFPAAHGHSAPKEPPPKLHQVRIVAKSLVG